MLSFELSDEQLMLRDLARDISRNSIALVAAHHDETSEFPWQLVKEGREIGLFNASIPEEYGGAGATVMEDCLVGEEMAWGCSGVGTIFGAHSLGATPIIIAGSEEQQKEFLGRMVDDEQIACYGLSEPEAGSEVAGILTSATRQGDKYIINDSKTFISNAGFADIIIVFAITDKSDTHHGMTAFIRKKECPD